MGTEKKYLELRDVTKEHSYSYEELQELEKRLIEAKQLAGIIHDNVKEQGEVITTITPVVEQVKETAVAATRTITDIPTKTEGDNDYYKYAIGAVGGAVCSTPFGPAFGLSIGVLALISGASIGSILGKLYL
jgi:hypothetical protein